VVSQYSLKRKRKLFPKGLGFRYEQYYITKRYWANGEKINTFQSNGGRLIKLVPKSDVGLRWGEIWKGGWERWPRVSDLLTAGVGSIGCSILF